MERNYIITLLQAVTQGTGKLLCSLYFRNIERNLLLRMHNFKMWIGIKRIKKIKLSINQNLTKWPIL